MHWVRNVVAPEPTAWSMAPPKLAAVLLLNVQPEAASVALPVMPIAPALAVDLFAVMSQLAKISDSSPARIAPPKVLLPFVSVMPDNLMALPVAAEVVLKIR